MFVQFIQGKVSDVGALRERWDEWSAHVKGGATGWLGATAGVTSAGDFVAAVRFESAEAAQRNADRPEQTAWWEETVIVFDGPVTFRDSDDVTLHFEGSDDAGFVQLMACSCRDRARFEELERQSLDAIRAERPDLVGAMRVWFEEGALLLCVDWFTSEAEARAGESEDLPADVQAAFDEWLSLVGDVRWYDLPDPWLDSAQH